MKISKNELRRLIAEELQATLQEQMPLTSFEGAGGYSYTERDDGGFDFMDSAGRTGTAAAGSAAARSIAAERDTGTSLYKAPAQPAIPELDAVSDYIPELDMVSMTEPSDAPGYGTAGTGFTAFQGRGRRGQARKAMKAMGATGAEARGAVRGAAKKCAPSGGHIHSLTGLSLRP